MSRAWPGLAVAALAIGFLGGRWTLQAPPGPAPLPVTPPPLPSPDVRALESDLRDAKTQVEFLKKEIAEQDRRRKGLETSLGITPGGRVPIPEVDREDQDFLPTTGNEPPMRIYNVQALIAASAAEAKGQGSEPAFTEETIKEFIKEYVDRPIWAEEGNSIDATGGRLFVTAPPETHKRVRLALDGLRAQLHIPKR